MSGTDLATLPADVRELLAGATDHDLATMFDAGQAEGATTGQREAAGLAMAELERRDREQARERKRAERREAARARRGAVDAAWHDAAYPESLRAEEATRGYMLSPAGEATGRGAFPMLWTCSDRAFTRYASEEMKRWREFDTPSFTRLADYRRDHRPGKVDNPWHDDPDWAEPGQAAREATPTPEPPAHAPAGGTIPPAPAGDPGASERAERAARRDQRVAEARARQAARGVTYRPRAPGAGAPPALGGPGAALAVPQDRAPAAYVTGTVVPAATREHIDGAQVLAQAYGWLGHMAYWPSEWALITAALYAASAHATDPKTGRLVWLYMPKFYLTSPEGGSGKSVMGRLTGALCPSAQRLAEMTKAALIDHLGQGITVLITELDTLVGTGRRTPWLPGLANVSYEFDGATARKEHGKSKPIPLFAPMILDGLDSVIHSTGAELRTLMGRCIIVHVRQAPDGYTAPRFDVAEREAAGRIRARLARWMAQEVSAGIGDAKPALPQGLGNRPADLWWNLFAVADAAGGPWPALARAACEHIESSTGLPGEDEADDYALEQQAERDGWAVVPTVPGWDE